MSSPWSAKLETRLSSLTDAASRESIQSLAKWIGFNRKHSKAFCITLALQMESRPWLCLQLVHHVLLLEHGNDSKWERMAETRSLLGNQVLLPALPTLDAATKERLGPLMDEWESKQVFAHENLVETMRKAMSGEAAAPQQKEEEEQPVAKAEEPKEETPVTEKPVAEKPVVTVEPVREKKKVKAEVKMDTYEATKKEETPKLETPKAHLKRAMSTEEVAFDFESSGIPYAKVEAREFLEPCKKIATLQIARDLRNDAAVQLSSRLSAVAPEIQEFCKKAQEAKEQGKEPPSLENAAHFAELLGDDILDIDLEEALVNTKTFASVVEQQREARKELIRLLIQSRCEFGANEAAETYYSLDGILDKLKERKQLLADAMDLEGLDFEEEDAAAAVEPKKMEPLTWYKPDEQPDAKRARIE